MPVGAREPDRETGGSGGDAEPAQELFLDRLQSPT